MARCSRPMWHNLLQPSKEATSCSLTTMDNVSVHKVEGIVEAIEARGAIPFYLPAYSPDSSTSFEFAKLKTILRKIRCIFA
jgi:transposase